jgi:hypothetical protein
MNKRGDARMDVASAKEYMRRLTKDHLLVAGFLGEIYLSKGVSRFFLMKNKDVPLQFFVSLKDFIAFPRNIPGRVFVYIGAAAYSAVQGEIQKKPRGGSRGVMTRSFSGR